MSSFWQTDYIVRTIPGIPYSRALHSPKCEFTVCLLNCASMLAGQFARARFSTFKQSSDIIQ